MKMVSRGGQTATSSEQRATRDRKEIGIRTGTETGKECIHPSKTHSARCCRDGWERHDLDLDRRIGWDGMDAPTNARTTGAGAGLQEGEKRRLLRRKLLGLKLRCTGM